MKIGLGLVAVCCCGGGKMGGRRRRLLGDQEDFIKHALCEVVVPDFRFGWG